MAALNKDYIESLKTSAAAGEYKPIPAGTYPMTIVETAIQDNKAGNGQSILLKFAVDGENYNGRLIYWRIAYTHPNKEAVRIGKEKLKSLLNALGLETIGNTDELQNKQVLCEVIIRQGDKQYGPQNDIAKFLPINSETTSSATASPGAMLW